MSALSFGQVPEFPPTLVGARPWHLPRFVGVEPVPLDEPEQESQQQLSDVASNANASASAITTDTDADAAILSATELRERAEQEGRAAGYEAGVLAGQEAAQQEAQRQRQELAQRFMRLEQAFNGQVAEIGDKLADQLTEIVVSSVRAVVMQELTTNPLIMREMLRQLMNKLHDNLTNAVLVAHSDDLLLIGEEGPLTRRADDQCARGQLRLEHGDGHVEIKLSDRLEKALAQLQASLLV